MTPSEIITQEAQKVGYDADIVLGKIYKIVQSEDAILLQKNDSLLLLIAIEPTAAELHLFTMDSPAKIVDALRYFVKQIKSSGLKKVYGNANETQADRLKKTLDLLDKMGVDVQKSDMPDYQWMATVEGSK